LSLGFSPAAVAATGAAGCACITPPGGIAAINTAATMIVAPRSCHRQVMPFLLRSNTPPAAAV
jgi:hypothetical protein